MRRRGGAQRESGGQVVHGAGGLCAPKPGAPLPLSQERGWANWNVDARARVLRFAEEVKVKLWLNGHYHGNATR